MSNSWLVLYTTFWAVICIIFALYLKRRLSDATAHVRNTLIILQLVAEENPRQVVGIYRSYATGRLREPFSADQAKEIEDAWHRLYFIGRLLYHGFIPEDPIVDLCRNRSVKIWFASREYIRATRKTASDHLHFFEYLAFLCLRRWLQIAPQSSLVFYDPVPGGQTRQISSVELDDELQQMEHELRVFGLLKSPSRVISRFRKA